MELNSLSSVSQSLRTDGDWLYPHWLFYMRIGCVFNVFACENVLSAEGVDESCAT